MSQWKLGIFFVSQPKILKLQKKWVCKDSHSYLEVAWKNTTLKLWVDRCEYLLFQNQQVQDIMTSKFPALKKKGIVRVRVVYESMKTGNIFCLTTKDSQNELAQVFTYTWELLGKKTFWNCESKEMVNTFCLNTNKLKMIWQPTLPHWKRVRLGL